MESVAGSCIFHSLEQHLVGVEFAGADRLVDARQILQHHISGTYVGVSNLGVANLPVGKSDVFTAGFKGDERVFGEKPVKVRLVSGSNCVAVRFLADAVSVEDHQHCWSMLNHCLPPKCEVFF